MKKSLLASALLATAVVGGAAVAGAGAGDGATVTRGPVAAFNVGDSGITGHAQMVRTASGSTIVDLHVRGLRPDTTYGAHVHARPCGTSLGGGHYIHPTETGGGSAELPKEIWPGPFTTDAAGVGRGRVAVPVIAGEDAVSVVVHAPQADGGAKIACADLR